MKDFFSKPALLLAFVLFCLMMWRPSLEWSGVALFLVLVIWHMASVWMESKRVYELQKPDFDRIRALETKVAELGQAERMRNQMF